MELRIPFFTNVDIGQDIYQKCAGEIAGEMQNELAVHRQSRSWRFLSTLFSQVNDSIPPGLINFSAAWFMLGREGREDSLITSPILRSARGKQWMRDMAEAGTLLSGVLRIMHPDQYRMGYEVMTGLMHYEQVNLALSTWPSVFNAATVISNRCCPMHRDNKGSFPLFDILISTGDYSNAPISILPVGIQFPNSPGSMCGFSGFGFRHGVAGADGARICHAFYMRRELQIFTGVVPCSWMTQDVYRRWIGESIGRSRFHWKLDIDNI
ncbi:hypothetical protein QCA50_020192 [Cerrena zonata]|uniref:2OGFeDO JBP1/TET oxygenase domain-containing protein n=1 Tax=Cerrena zonata TaxID=2478898 RepID=A0AAW0F9K5_9APHY